jgi:hypothetical protein
MLDFSEKLVENCVVAKPAAFLPFKKCKVLAQQPVIGGFRPDLLLSTSESGVTLLEIQLHALDRAHLYKVLEYRDLYAEIHGGPAPDIALYCEALPEKYLPILKTHNIEVIRFDRYDFLRRALAACPTILQQFVRLAPEAEDYARERVPLHKRRGRFDFEPLHWWFRLSPAEAMVHFESELCELGLKSSDLPRPYYQTIYNDLSGWSADPYVGVVEALFRPDAWNWNHLLREQHGRLVFDRPKISIGCHITSKGNFSAYWHERSAYSREEDGWLIPPSTSSYGYGRPQNELLYIRDARYLDPKPGVGRRLEEDGDWSSLDSIFVSWIVASYRELCAVAGTVCDVELVSDIDIVLSDSIRKGRWNDRQFIVGWDIVSADDKARNEAERELANFESEFGLSVEAFVEAYNVGRAINPESRALAPSHVLVEIERRGGKMTARQVRSTIDLLRLVNHQLASTLSTPIPPA